MYSDIFYNVFVDYIIKTHGLMKRMFWNYLPEKSTLKYMYERRKKFLNYLKKLRDKRRNYKSYMFILFTILSSRNN